MQIIVAVLVFFFAFVTTASAQSECNCTVTVGPPIVFTEDPLILESESDPHYFMVEEVFVDVGECVIFISYQTGITSTYNEVTKGGLYKVHKLRLSERVTKEYPAFAKYPTETELTLSEVMNAAVDECLPTEEPNS